MNQKILDILFWVFTLLPFLIAIILILFLPQTVPETVPMHWTLDHEANGYGSKYLILLIPVLFAISSIMMIIIMGIIEDSTWQGNTLIDQIIIQYLPLFTSFILFCVSIGLFWSIASASLFI